MRALLLCCLLCACTPEQLDQGIMQSLDGISKIDAPIHKSYKRELGVSSCIEPSKNDTQIVACVREAMECPTTMQSGECMAKSMKEWAPTKAIMITIHNAWCAVDANAEGCKEESKP